MRLTASSGNVLSWAPGAAPRPRRAPAERLPDAPAVCEDARVAHVALSSTRNPRVRAAAALRDRRARDEAGPDARRRRPRARRGRSRAGRAIVEVFVDPGRLGARTAGRPPSRPPARPARTIIEVTATVVDSLAYGDRGEGIVAVARDPATSLDGAVAAGRTRSSSSSRASRSRATWVRVLRSADGAGADAVIAADPRTDLFNPNAIRASQGTIFAVPRGRRAGDGGPRAGCAPPACESWRPASTARRRTPSRTSGARSRSCSAARRRASATPGRATTSTPSGCRCSASPTASTSRSPPPSCCTRRGDSAARRDGQARLTRHARPFDFVVIGAGPAGEAAAHKARELGATVAVVDRRWFGGSCPHIGCVPSKALLHAAERHAAGADYPWQRASERRDYMVNRAAGRRRARRQLARRGRSRRPAPSTFRGEGRITARGRVDGHRRRRRHDRARGARTSSSRSARRSKVPPIEGLAETAALDEPRGDADPRAAAQPARPRRRPDRLRARPGLRAVRRADDRRPVRARASSRPSIRATPRSSASRWSATARRSGPAFARVRARAGAGTDGAHVIELDDGSTAEGHVILLAVGPRVPARATSGSSTTASRSPARTPTAATAGCGSPTGCGSPGDPAGPGAAHPPGPLPGRAGRPDGARRGDRPRLPGAAAGDVHGARVGVGGHEPRPGARRPGSTRSSASRTSRRAPRATRSRPRPAT